MVDNDRQLKQFLTQNQNPIEDNGFTEKVMKRIPTYSSNSRIMLVWTAIGVVLAFATFVLSDNLTKVCPVFTFPKISIESVLRFVNLKYIIGFVAVYLLCVKESLNYLRSILSDGKWTIQ